MNVSLSTILRVDVDPELKLVAAILATALADARAGDTEALAWLDSPRCLRLLGYLVPSLGDITDTGLQSRLLMAAKSEAVCRMEIAA